MKSQSKQNENHVTPAYQFGRRLFLAGLVVSATGCKNFVERAQSPDNQILQLHEDKDSETRYIGDICTIRGLEYAKVEGIGLAVGLRGTGSNPLPSGQRDYLVKELEMKHDGDNVERTIASDSSELVLLQGKLPPGIRKGEKFDIEIRTMPKTEASSLENGMVLQTRMRPMAVLGRSVKKGHVIAMGKGRILVDALFESRKDQPNRLHGYILGGGIAMEDRELQLTIQGDDYAPKTSTMIARAINSRFTRIDNHGRHGVAEPVTDRVIEIEVPATYRHNIGRYLQVIANMSHSESTAERLVRMERLETELVEPNKAGLTSVRLEALGQDGIPILKRALLKDDLEIKFYAAQALAYMGEIDGVDHLKLVAETEPAFRWHALTALASLKEIEAGMALSDLLHVRSAETRYGAFRAMRARSPQDATIAGAWLGDFFLHRVPSKTEPMLHFARNKRPEIVIFNEDQTVTDEFLHVESGTTIRATGNGTVTLVRYRSDNEEVRKVCRNRIADVIEMMADAGFGYGDVLSVLQDSKNADCLNTRLVVNAVPKLGRTYVPGKTAGELPPERSDRYVAEDLPGLFYDGDEIAEDLDQSEENATRTTTRFENSKKNKSNWSKMKRWFARDENE
jgi:flagellar basal body P-ring protein FlgI